MWFPLYTHISPPKRRSIRLYSLLFLIFGCTGALAQEKMLSPEEAVAVALKNNYQILLLKADSTAAAIDYSFAKAAFLPRINANAGKVWNNNDQRQKFNDGTERERKGIFSNNLNLGASLNWTIFDGLRMFIARDRLAELQRLGGLNIKTQVVNTVAAVLIQYYNIVRQGQQLKAIEEQMSISQERVKLAEKKLSVGLGAKPEMLQAKVDLNAQKAARLRQITLIEQLREQLSQLMGIESQTGYSVSDTIPVNPNLNLDELYAGLEKGNPTLQTLLKTKQLAELNLKDIRASRFPVVSFNSAYNFSRLDNKAVVNPFTPLFSRNTGFNYGFTASIPLLNGLNVKRQEQQARLAIGYQDLLYQQQKLQLSIALKNAFKDYQLQKQALVLEEENILLAKENVMIALERLKQGVSTSLELREAQKSLEEGYNRLIAARYALKLAETELLRIRGDLVK